MSVFETVVVHNLIYNNMNNLIEKIFFAACGDI